MTDLEKLAVEAMTELVDSKCVNCEDGEAGLLGTSIPVLAKFLERARAAGRIEGLEEAAQAVVDACEACGGAGGTMRAEWDVIAVADEHGEPQPMQVPVEIHEPCEYCGRPVSAIRARIQELKGE